KVRFDHHLDHVLSGYARHELNIFFVPYEKLKVDTARTVLDNAKVLGEPYSSLFVEDEVLMEEVQAEAKKLGSKAGFAQVRKGLTGNWRYLFSAEELERMQAWINAKIQ
ncbi:hypothetical protein HPB47_024519, partial [Ixodes persulcatus]